MNNDCPTGMLVDLSEPAELEMDFAMLEPITSVLKFSCSPVISNKENVETPDQTKTYLESNPFGKSYIADDFDCEFLDDEKLDDLTRSLSSSSSGDDLVSLGCESTVLTKKTLIRKDDQLSVKQFVEVFKEANTVAVQLENLSRETPSKPETYCVTPLLERTSCNLPLLTPKQILKNKFDLEKDVEDAVIRKQKFNIENTPPAIPQLSVKPEARVQPILKTQIKTKECTAATISKTLRANKNRVINAVISATRPSVPLKATVQLPSKTPMGLTRTYSDHKNSLSNTNSNITSKPKSHNFVSSNVARFSPRTTNATVFRSASFSAGSIPERRRSALPSTSFSYVNPADHSKALDQEQRQIGVVKISVKSTTRKSYGSAGATPVMPFSARSSVSFVEPSPKKLSNPILRLTPSKSAIPKSSSLVKRSSSDCGQYKRRSLPVYAKSASLSTPHK